ncbi:sensor histidine kinase [Streptomyces aurantiogriseus]|uniref:histidine kinase n=1 Tax=Streptomyces aurantiogriseus TaxID=66870 RepID=A0A918FB91_9ACTN|nr:nitrate- and nitrite sensing domain-containing protein [Streptomyces aurantiogriseus]GGR26976.1 histidine kinase [Streptomyces aurantiogriseus]
MSPRTGARRRRLGSIRLSLILLALVPSVTLAAMWGVTTIQMFSEGLRLREQTELSRATGALGTEATLALQQERSLSAVWLATPAGSRAPLEAQRKKTDAAVARLVARSDDIQRAPARVRDRMYSVVASVSSLEYYRGQVDDPTNITPAQALDQYTSIIDDQIHAFQELSQVDDGDLTSQAGPLVALEHAAELVSEEDLHLTLAGPKRRMDEKEWAAFAQTVNARRWLVEDQIVPSLTGSAKTQTERILQSRDWQTLESVEDRVLAARAKQRGNGDIVLPDVQKEWRAALIAVSEQYSVLIRQQTGVLLRNSADEARGLLIKAASLSTGGLVALLLCVGVSWRITRSLSRRLRGLRMATLSLAHERLPDVVARLDRGETVDVDSATPPLDYGGDELGQVAQAFNTAQRTAVHTAVELADTRRGFQKVILGIARQSQNLVNLQLSKLDALERQHQDPEVLQGLYELDSTASQLRRYEENLVIISGGRPGRSWSEPVALVDILRSAVGEVAEYRRVEVHTEEEVSIAPPAVADVIHLLAELIDNATSYSPAPNPVGVRAAQVAKGLAIEVEDRGLGLSEEDYASFNAQLAVPPQFDVVALADDLRLGMFVIARLATRHGITVTLRPSPYGGTTAIVLVPYDIVVREAPASESPEAGVSPAPGTVVSPAPEADLAPAGQSAPDAARETFGEQRKARETPDTAREASGPARRVTGPAREPSGPARDTSTPDPEHSRSGPERNSPLPVRRRSTPAHDPSAPADGTPASAASAGDASPAADGTATAAADAPPPADTSSALAPDASAPGPDSPVTAGRADAPTPKTTAGPGTPVTPAGTDSPTPNTPNTTDEPSTPVTADRAGGRMRGVAAVTSSSAAVSARPHALAPLPRRVPQTSLAAELREEPGAVEEDGFPDDFTAERAASSLGGFQRGTLRAREDDDVPPFGPEESAPSAPGPPVTAAGTSPTTTPPADRS